MLLVLLLKICVSTILYLSFIVSYNTYCIMPTFFCIISFSYSWYVRRALLWFHWNHCQKIIEMFLILVSGKWCINDESIKFWIDYCICFSDFFLYPLMVFLSLFWIKNEEYVKLNNTHEIFLFHINSSMKYGFKANSRFIQYIIWLGWKRSTNRCYGKLINGIIYNIYIMWPWKYIFPKELFDI